jgi:hypothetical protein
LLTARAPCCLQTNRPGSTFSGFLASHEPSSLTAALAAGTYSLLQQGVTSVQLPFAFSDLLPPPGPAAPSKQGTKGAAAAPTPQPQPQQQQCWQVPYNSIKLRPGGNSSGNDSSSAPCVSMLPNTTALDRYLWGVQWFAAHGLYVTLSSSSSSCPTNSSSSGGCSDADADAYGSARAFAAAWSAVWRAVAALPCFASDLQGRLFLQLLSNPAAGGYLWEGGSSSSSSDATTHQQLPGGAAVATLVWRGWLPPHHLACTHGAVALRSACCSCCGRPGRAIPGSHGHG